MSSRNTLGLEFFLYLGNQGQCPADESLAWAPQGHQTNREMEVAEYSRAIGSSGLVCDPVSYPQDRKVTFACELFSLTMPTLEFTPE